MPVRSFLLARSNSTDGGTEAAATPQMDPRRNPAPTAHLFVARMDGAAKASWVMMGALTTRRHGIIVQIATAPTVLGTVYGLRVEIPQHILALTPLASLASVVVCLLRKPFALHLASLM
jgi:hypothetical protein